MTVYNLNKGIGWASSGVEYSQAYRARIFRKLNIDAKFIFTDLILHTNIEHLTQNIGLLDSEVIYLYQFFTDIKIAPTTYTLTDVLNGMNLPVEGTETEGNRVRFYFNQRRQFLSCYLKKDSEEIVERVEFVVDGKLIRKDYYSYTRVMSEYYAPENGKATVYLRRFYNENQTVAFEEVVDGEQSLFRFTDCILYSKEQLFAYMLKQLDLQADDLLVVDRATGIFEAVLNERGPAKIAVVIHAEHYNTEHTTSDYILWNNYYDYQFMLSDEVDYFISSTDAQKELLEAQFDHFYHTHPRVVTIPVGSVDAIQRSNERQSYSLMTASRLASEKHVDWLVEAVVQAQKILPDLTFDIYGKGPESPKIEEAIQRHNAQAFIRLKGHANLAEVYQNYEVYLTASTSEGFGLSLLEAISSGLPIIGLDVPYGNPTFVDSGLNGYLINESKVSQASTIIHKLSQAIIRLYEGDLSAFQEHSYKKASGYLTEVVEATWQSVIKEVQCD